MTGAVNVRGVVITGKQLIFTIIVSYFGGNVQMKYWQGKILFRYSDGKMYSIDFKDEYTVRDLIGIESAIEAIKKRWY